MRLLDLAMCILQQHGIASLQHAGPPERERSAVIAELEAAAARFDAENLDARVRNERMKHADRIRAAADTGDDGVRQFPDLCQRLRARLAADDRLQLAHEIRIRMRT